MVDIKQIKELRDATSVSITECKKALKEADGDFEKAKQVLMERGREIAENRAARETAEGIIDSYIHAGGRVGVMIELHCESDFVARSEDFQQLSHEICLQIAAMDPEETPLMEQPWIRDPKKNIKELIEEYITKFGENITLERFVRYEL
ncbi:MAG: translation elongation factor Ts [Candidatus Nealsonbacteria bacterium]|nr:translation elongation factor Ts [Candidatus Nealsonbacteria bacterium]